jgi:hypothetical protein
MESVGDRSAKKLGPPLSIGRNCRGGARRQVGPELPESCYGRGPSFKLGCLNFQQLFFVVIYGYLLGSPVDRAVSRQLSFVSAVARPPAYSAESANFPPCRAVHVIAMASFSRGLGSQFFLLVRPQAPCKCAATPQLASHILFRLPRSPFQPHTRSRFLQTAARSNAPVRGAPGPKSTPKNAAPLLTPATGTPLPSRIISYASQLALRNRVTLYEAPSHFWFRFSSISAAAFCIMYTTYQYWAIYLHPPPDLAWWVPHAYGAILVFMSCVGIYFGMGITRIVRSIDAVSVSSLLAANKGKLPKALVRDAGVGTGTTSPIYIEVEIQRVIPFLPRRKFRVWPDQIELPFRMADAVAAQSGGAASKAPMTLKQQVEAQRAEKERRAAERKYNMDHLLTAPFRDAKKGFKMMWEGMARAFHREGFAKVDIGGTFYKLDVTDGWAMDQGRAMDRVLPIKQVKVR